MKTDGVSFVVFGGLHEGNTPRVGCTYTVTDIWMTAKGRTYVLTETTELNPCGHRVVDVVTGDEGTSYCASCEREARARDAATKGRA